MTMGIARGVLGLVLGLVCIITITVVSGTEHTSKPPKVEAFFQGSCSSWHPCDQECIELDGGFQCGCKPGYKLHDNGFSCIELPLETASSSSTPPPSIPDHDSTETARDDKALEDHANDADNQEDEIANLLEKEPEKSDVEESLIGLVHAQDQHMMMMGDAPAAKVDDDLDDDNDDDDDDEDDQLVTKRLYKWKDPYAPYASRESREFKWVNPYKSLEEREKIKAQYEPKPVWEYYQADDSSQVQAATEAPTTEPSKDKDDKDDEDGKKKGKGKGRGKGRKGKGRKGKGRNKNKNKQRMKSIVDPNFDVNTHQSDSIISNDVLDNTSPMSPYSSSGAPSSSSSVFPTGLPRYQSCDDLHCKGGGRCVADKMRGGVRCQCKLGTQGEFCENDIVVRYPKFLGTGYVAFPVLRGAYKELTVTVEFRPDTHSGLLVFSSEHPNARSDFISISLVDGKAEFRFDCGTGPAVITTENSVVLGEWNSITVSRTDMYGWIQLNSGPQVKGRSRGLFSRITFREDLYLGGYRDNNLVGARTGMQWGFVGCIRFLRVNGKTYDMRKGAYVGDAIHGVDVGECSINVCDRVKCMNGGTCQADSADSSVCLCPLGSAGDRCETKIDIHVPHFDGSSYMQYLGLRRTVLSFAEVEIVLKAEAPDGLIFYNGYTTDRTGDYISLALKNGYVEFTFDLGTGPAYIKSRTPLTLNEWHVVRFSRTGRDGWLQIDNQVAVEGMAKGAYTQLTLTLDLFIGGHRNFDEVNQGVGMHKAFKGCLQKVVINERVLKLMEEAIDGSNVDNCNHPCVGQPCMNGGRCIAIKDFYKCSCPLGFESSNCEDRKVRYRYRFKRAIVDPITTPMFNGDGFLTFLDPALMLKVRGLKIDIQLKIKAREPNGLLLWTGEKVMTPYSDYLAIGLRGGRVEFRYNLGSGEVVITFDNSTRRIDDNKWHSIRVQRNSQLGYLELDGTEVVEGTSPGTLKQLNVPNKLYIGGMALDEIAHGTSRKYLSGFVGCIKDVTLATDFKLDLMSDAADGENIHQCKDPGPVGKDKQQAGR